MKDLINSFRDAVGLLRFKHLRTGQAFWWRGVLWVKQAGLMAVGPDKRVIYFNRNAKVKGA